MRTITSIDMAVLQTAIVLVLFFADSIEGAVGNANTHYVHSLFPAIAGILVVLMNVYLIMRYTVYLTGRYECESQQQHN